jgi:uncharacterized membrane protein YdbT with pleckstrin-like domain
MSTEEPTVFRTRLHPVVLAGTAGFAAFVVLATTLIIVRNELSTRTIVLLCAASALIVVVSFASPILRWRTSEFAVTTRRLRVRLGIREKVRLEMPLAAVKEVRVERPFVGRVLDYGTVRIVGGGVADVFARVAEPEALRDAISSATRDLVSGRGGARVGRGK